MCITYLIYHSNVYLFYNILQIRLFIHSISLNFVNKTLYETTIAWLNLLSFFYLFQSHLAVMNEKMQVRLDYTTISLGIQKHAILNL